MRGNQLSVSGAPRQLMRCVLQSEARMSRCCFRDRMLLNLRMYGEDRSEEGSHGSISCFFGSYFTFLGNLGFVWKKIMTFPGVKLMN